MCAGHETPLSLMLLAAARVSPNAHGAIFKGVTWSQTTEGGQRYRSCILHQKEGSRPEGVKFRQAGGADDSRKGVLAQEMATGVAGLRGPGHEADVIRDAGGGGAAEGGGDGAMARRWRGA